MPHIVFDHDFLYANTSMCTQIGDLVCISSRADMGWFKGYVVKGGVKGAKGIFPCNYITLLETSKTAEGGVGGSSGNGESKAGPGREAKDANVDGGSDENSQASGGYRP